MIIGFFIFSQLNCVDTRKRGRKKLKQSNPYNNTCNLVICIVTLEHTKWIRTSYFKNRRSTSLCPCLFQTFSTSLCFLAVFPILAFRCQKSIRYFLHGLLLSFFVKQMVQDSKRGVRRQTAQRMHHLVIIDTISPYKHGDY